MEISKIFKKETHMENKKNVNVKHIHERTERNKKTKERSKREEEKDVVQHPVCSDYIIVSLQLVILSKSNCKYGR